MTFSGLGKKEHDTCPHSSSKRQSSIFPSISQQRCKKRKRNDKMLPLALTNEDCCMVDGPSFDVVDHDKKVERTDVKRRTRARKIVAINTSRNEVYEVPNRADIPPRERLAIWLSYGDMMQIKRRCMMSIRDMRTWGVDNVPNGECFRGLETFRHESEERRESKRFTNNIVLEYQKSLNNRQSMDFELLAKTYGDYSRSSVAEAHRQGVIDATEA